jgi:hypothetical protein
VTLPEAFYRPNPDGTYDSTEATVGPWDGALQHGGPPAALLGGILERLGGRSDMRIAHFVLDFLGPVPVSPLRVTAEVLRPGKRIELVAARVEAGGRDVLRASAWRLQVGPNRSPVIQQPSTLPSLPEADSPELFESVPSFGYGRAMAWRFAKGGFGQPGPATVWARPRIPLLPGQPTSPLERLLLMVDSANGVSWELDIARYTFVPVSLTVDLTRDAIGEWTGMAARTSFAGDGVGTTRANLFDGSGEIGEALQALFVAAR